MDVALCGAELNNKQTFEAKPNFLKFLADSPESCPRVQIEAQPAARLVLLPDQRS